MGAKQRRYRLIFESQTPTESRVKEMVAHELGDNVEVTHWWVESEKSFPIILANGAGQVPVNLTVAGVVYQDSDDPEVEPETDSEPDSETDTEPLTLESMFDRACDLFERMFDEFDGEMLDEEGFQRIRQEFDRYRRNARRSRMVHETSQTVRKAVRAGLDALNEEIGILTRDLFGDDDDKK